MKTFFWDVFISDYLEFSLEVIGWNGQNNWNDEDCSKFIKEISKSEL